MAVNAWSATAALNATVGSVNIAENCNPGNLNDGQREMMAEIVNAIPGYRSSDFSLVGSGDETAALTAFINHAIANPGIPHILEAKTYSFSAALPSIAVSNVILQGSEPGIHDIGTLVTGTVLKWTGGAAHSTTGMTIAPVSGAGNQRLSGIVFKGVGFDCNSGNLGTAISIQSVRDCEVDVAVANPFATGVYLGVVATLGESRDLQRNRIKVTSRSIEATTGYGLVLDGDATANVSLNRIEVDAQITNTPAVKCINSDGNKWLHVRAAQASGTALYGMEFYGGASSGVSSRAEKIEFYSSPLPVKAYGTEAYTVASKSHSIVLDVGNNTPVPVLGTGATIAVLNQWQSYTPAVTSTTGTLTTVASASGQFMVSDAGVCMFSANFTITTNGTGAGTLRVTLPLTVGGTVATAGRGCERSGTGKALFVDIAPGNTYATVNFSDGTYPGADGRVFSVAGVFRSVF